jgi:succinate dehydrogenase/fumarate reductase cytochrome b subunit
MLDTKSAPKPGESSWLWMLKIFSGLLIIIILVIHFIVNHFLAPEGLLTFNDVVQYYSNNPIVPIMEGFFLFFVVTHSLTGVRSIFLDLNPSRSVRRVMDIVLIGIGVVSIVYGFWLLGAILAQAPAA